MITANAPGSHGAAPAAVGCRCQHRRPHAPAARVTCRAPTGKRVDAAAPNLKRRGLVLCSICNVMLPPSRGEVVGDREMRTGWKKMYQTVLGSGTSSAQTWLLMTHTVGPPSSSRSLLRHHTESHMAWDGHLPYRSSGSVGPATRLHNNTDSEEGEQQQEQEQTEERHPSPSCSQFFLRGGRGRPFRYNSPGGDRQFLVAQSSQHV
jgi:hypothetical protein